MAQVRSDNVLLNAPKLLDDRAGKIALVNGYNTTVPYASIVEANVSINYLYRSVGLTVNVLVSGALTEYWYKDGVADVNLVAKFSGGTYTSDNGITRVGSNFQLGGTLIQATSLLGVFNLSVNDGTVSIGSATDNGSAARLFVNRPVGSFGMAVYGEKATDPSATDLGIGVRGNRNISSASFSSASVQAGVYGELGMQGATGFAFSGGAFVNLSGLVGVFTMYSNTGNLVAGNSMFSGGAYYCNFAGAGNVDKVAALRVQYPQNTPTYASYSGTVTNLYGLFIEDYSNSTLAARITNRWGIYQSGAGEKNYIGGDQYYNKIKPATGSYMLTVDSTGLVSSQAIAGAATVPINTLLAATGTNNIDNANYNQTWTWNTLAGNTGLKLSSTSTAAAGNNQILLQAVLTGGNGTNQSTYSIYGDNGHTGAGSLNYGVYGTASLSGLNIGVQGTTAGAADYGVQGSNSGDGYGVRGTSSGTGYGGYFTNGGISGTGYGLYASKTGTATTNIGAQFQATGATNNYAIIVPASSGNVGFGTSTPSAKALLEISSTTQGFLPPRMTTVQRDAITAVPAGLLIYNITTNKLNVFTTIWETVTSS